MTPSSSLERLQYIGEGLGILGAALVALPSALSRSAGFGVWIVGNTAWIIYGRRSGNWHMVRMFGVYFITAITGLYWAIRGVGA